MERKASKHINETVEYLTARLNGEKDGRVRDRLRAVILVKQGELKRTTVAESVLVDYATLKGWLKKYNERGLEAALINATGSHKAEIIIRHINKALEKTLNSSEDFFHGYTDAVVNERKKFGLDIKYNTLRT